MEKETKVLASDSWFLFHVLLFWLTFRQLSAHFFFYLRGGEGEGGGDI